MLPGEDLDAFVEDFGDLVKVASRGIERLALLEKVPGETLNGLSQGVGVRLVGRADVFGCLTAVDVVNVTGGHCAGVTTRSVSRPAMAMAPLCASTSTRYRHDDET